MTPHEPARGEQGFTLIEVLVAFAVTALLLTIIMPAALTAGEREKRAQQKQRAMNLVSTLVRERASGPWEEGEQTGRSGGLEWVTDEVVIRHDPRGFLALTRIEGRAADAGGHLLFSATTRRLRRVDIQ